MDEIVEKEGSAEPERPPQPRTSSHDIWGTDPESPRPGNGTDPDEQGNLRGWYPEVWWDWKHDDEPAEPVEASPPPASEPDAPAEPTHEEPSEPAPDPAAEAWDQPFAMGEADPSGHAHPDPLDAYGSDVEPGPPSFDGDEEFTWTFNPSPAEAPATAEGFSEPHLDGPEAPESTAPDQWSYEHGADFAEPEEPAEEPLAPGFPTDGDQGRLAGIFDSPDGSPFEASPWDAREEVALPPPPESFEYVDVPERWAFAGRRLRRNRREAAETSPRHESNAPRGRHRRRKSAEEADAEPNSFLDEAPQPDPGADEGRWHLGAAARVLAIILPMAAAAMAVVPHLR